MLIAQAQKDDLKECTFKPKILQTKVAKEFFAELEPSREMRLQKHLERKQMNMKVQLKAKNEKEVKELVFKPAITRYESKGKIATTKQKCETSDTFDFKPKINRKSKEIILNDVRREHDPATRLYQQSKEK